MGRRRRRASGKPKKVKAAQRSAARGGRRAPVRPPDAKEAPGHEKTRGPAADVPKRGAEPVGRPTSSVSTVGRSAPVVAAAGAGRPKRAEDAEAARFRGEAWPVFGCAACLGFASMVGLVALLDELSMHVQPLPVATGVVAIPMFAGIGVGLWWPRRVIRRRVRAADTRWLSAPEEGDEGARSAATPPIDLNFAASVTGSLVLAYGLGWLMLAQLVSWLEWLRATLVTRFVWPPWLYLTVLGGMVAVAVAVTMLIGTAVLIAVHGWFRVSLTETARIPRLWLTLLGGAVVGSLLTAQTASPADLALLAPLGVFVAGALSVFRKSEVARDPTRIPLSRTARPARRGMMSAGLAAGAVGLAIQCAGGWEIAWGPVLGGHALWLCVGGFVGVMGGWWSKRVEPSGRHAVLPMLAAGVLWLAPNWFGGLDMVEQAGWRLVLVGACAGATLTIAGRQLTLVCGNLQYALHACGLAVVVGALGGFTFGAVAGPALGPVRLLVLSPLLLLMFTGILLSVDDRFASRMRLSGVLAVGAWWLLLPLAQVAPPPAAQTAKMGGPGLAGRQAADMSDGGKWEERIRDFLGQGARRVKTIEFGSVANVRHLDFDLSTDRPDVVLIRPGRERWGVLSVQKQKLLRRAQRGVIRGGRVLVEDPFEGEELAGLIRYAWPTAWRSGQVLHVRYRGIEKQYFVLGPAAGEWHARLADHAADEFGTDLIALRDALLTAR